MEMTTKRPYIIRATYDWIVDNALTPHLLVDTTVSEVKVPVAHINPDKTIVLNVAPVAIRNLKIELTVITFNAAFPGLKADIYLPIESVRAIYALENGQGDMFAADLDGRLAINQTKLKKVSGNATNSKNKISSENKDKPKLRIVKKTQD